MRILILQDHQCRVRPGEVTFSAEIDPTITKVMATFHWRQVAAPMLTIDSFAAMRCR